MTGAGAAVPAWAGIFIEWMHPAAIIFAVALPLTRACIRRYHKTTPCFQTSSVTHDVASGLTMPSFIALALSGMSPALSSHVEGHAAILAGAMGIVYTIGGIMKAHH